MLRRIVTYLQIGWVLLLLSLPPIINSFQVIDFNRTIPEDWPLLREALEGRRVKLDHEHPHTLESWNNLIELYEVLGKPEKAEEWRAKLPQKEAVEE